MKLYFIYMIRQNRVCKFLMAEAINRQRNLWGGEIFPFLLGTVVQRLGLTAVNRTTEVQILPVPFELIYLSQCKSQLSRIQPRELSNSSQVKILVPGKSQVSLKVIKVKLLSHPRLGGSRVLMGIRAGLK